VSALASRLLFAVLLLLAMNAPTSGAQPLRLHAANALLVIQPPFPRSSDRSYPIVIYQEPGVGRITALTFQEMRQRVPAFAAEEDRLMIPASRRKGPWVRIHYDDAGREGWIRLERGWQVVHWDDYLPGLGVRLMPGLKKNFYLLQEAPALNPPDNGRPLQDETLRIEAVEGPWALVETASGGTGWIRWRDDDGRLTVTPWQEPENR
jgi:hypothetical protein